MEHRIYGTFVLHQIRHLIQDLPARYALLLALGNLFPTLQQWAQKSGEEPICQQQNYRLEIVISFTTIITEPANTAELSTNTRFTV